MILYTLKKYVNEKLSAANGKFFAYPVITQTYGTFACFAPHALKGQKPLAQGIALSGRVG